MNMLDKTAHCLFEQSGTFKNEFKKLGFDAFDYDILDDFGETDFVVDLFEQIQMAYYGKRSIFDDMKKDDIVMAFFPCTRFENQIAMSFRGQQYQDRDKDAEFLLNRAIGLEDERAKFYKQLCALIVVCLRKGLQLIIENPYSTQSYIYQYLPIRPSIIILDRSLYGDFYKKPTMFYFVNLEPKNNIPLYVDLVGETKQIEKTCNKVERSLISPQFAKNFINFYIL